LLPLRTLLDRLDHRLSVLVNGSVDLPPRQQTLRATLDWSFGLLSDAERWLLPRLAVFSGGCSLDAANAIGGESRDVTENLASLLDKSLLLQRESPAGEARFWMLEAIHEYAQEHLEQCGEQEMIRSRHASYYLSLAEAAESELRGAPSSVWLDRLEQEHDNLRAAMQWALATANPQLALRLGLALERYLDIRGHVNEGQRWLESALSLPAPVEPALRARALHSAGRIAWLRGEYDHATARHEQSLATYRRLGDDRGVALELNSLGNVRHYEGDYARAAELYQESLTIHREQGNHTGMAAVLNSLGVLARNRGELTRARELYQQSLEEYRAIGDTRNVALLQNNLARVARDEGDWTGAARLARDSLTLFNDLVDPWGVAMVLTNLGVISQSAGDSQAGTRLFGAAEALRETSTGSPGLSVSPSERAAYDAAVAAARADLGEDCFREAWEAGTRLSLQAAVEQARGLAPPAAPSPRADDAALLTGREREVARMVARGQTNRQIAQALVISEWTVDAHLRHIFAKLGAHSRTQVATWVAEQARESNY
jgi:non-specific serine/threonine protein kinase